MTQRNINLGLQELPRPVVLDDEIVARWRTIHDAVADSFSRSPRVKTRGDWASNLDMNEGDLSLALSYDQRYKQWEQEGKIGKPPQRKNLGEWRLEDIMTQTQVAAIAQYFCKIAGGKFVPFSEDEHRKESERKRKQAELEKLREQRAEIMARMQQLEMEVGSAA